MITLAPLAPETHEETTALKADRSEELASIEVKFAEHLNLFGLELQELEDNAGFMAQITTKAKFGEREVDKKEKRLHQNRIKHFLEALSSFYKRTHKIAMNDIKAAEIAVPKAISVINDVIRHLKDTPDTGNKTIDKNKNDALEKARNEKKNLNRLKNEVLPAYKKKLEQEPPIEIQEIENIREEIQEETKKNSVFGRIYNAARNVSKYTSQAMAGAAYVTAGILKAKFKRDPSIYNNFAADKPSELKPSKSLADQLLAAAKKTPFMKSYNDNDLDSEEHEAPAPDEPEDKLKDNGPEPETLEP